MKAHAPAPDADLDPPRLIEDPEWQRYLDGVIQTIRQQERDPKRRLRIFEELQVLAETAELDEKAELRERTRAKRATQTSDRADMALPLV